MSFEDFVVRATTRPTRAGYVPYDYQRRIAREGLPELLGVPTGSGKTLAAVLPWLWRLRINPDTRSLTPHRLVYVLPMRTLVEQTVGEISGWLDALGLSDVVQLHVLMGGVDRDDDTWQMNPAAPAIFVGTQDMVMSRALLRGYAEPRSRWPISFGLLHAGTQWVFDETQLLGPALPTSAQLQGLRDVLGMAAPTATMWMSATLDAESLHTPDHPAPSTPIEISDEDRTGPLGGRLRATRRVGRAALPDDPRRYPEALAGLLIDRHVPGTQTIAILNTVARAVSVYQALRASLPEEQLLLVHSRFRRGERQRLTERLNADIPPFGRVVISTQVLEAGVDISSRTLFTEAAPWTSIVQRAGRCNRAGEHGEDAHLLWSPPPKMMASPYEADDLKHSMAALGEIEGQAMTSMALQRMDVDSVRPVHAMLRRRDLLQLFDTLPDLSGADLDVGQWIRDGDDTTVFVAWRDFEKDPDPDAPFPGSAELCPAPVAEVRKLRSDRLWAFDRVDGTWRKVRANGGDVVPGAVLLMKAADGGYDTTLGWAPKQRAPVSPLGGSVPPDSIGRDDLAVQAGRWVSLVEHSSDVERETAALVAAFEGRLTGLRAEHVEAAALAGRYHDIGKAHPAFQGMLRSTLQPGDPDPGSGAWAKSGRGGGRHERRYLRHELVSALMLLHPACGLLDGIGEPDLVAYLVAAHHGKVRVSVRSLPAESIYEPPQILGVRKGDTIPRVEMPDGEAVPALDIDPARLMLGDTSGHDSWTVRVLGLRDRANLGPFRLAFLEALVRMADWRVSRSYREETT